MYCINKKKYVLPFMNMKITCMYLLIGYHAFHWKKCLHIHTYLLIFPKIDKLFTNQNSYNTSNIIFMTQFAIFNFYTRD